MRAAHPRPPSANVEHLDVGQRTRRGGGGSVRPTCQAIGANDDQPHMSSRVVATGLAFACVIEGNLEGVDVAASFAVVHDADGRARGVSEEDVREVIARKRSIAAMYPMGSEDAAALAEVADRAEAELGDGYLTDETLADLFNLEVVGPVDDGVLGPQTVSIQSLRPARTRVIASLRLPRLCILPRRRLVRVTPRRREQRGATRRTSRGSPLGDPSRPRSDLVRPRGRR